MDIQKHAILLIVVSIIAIAGVFFLLQQPREVEQVAAPQRQSNEIQEKMPDQETPQERDEVVTLTPQPLQQEEVLSVSPIIPQEPEYANTVTNENLLVVEGDDVLEIVNTHYIVRNGILLKDNATLIIRDSKIEHQKDYTFQYELKATGNSKVIIEDSVVANSCTGSLNWNFFDTSSMVSSNVTQEECNIWHLFTNQSVAVVDSAVFNGTFCDFAKGTISNSQDMEIELCFPEGAVVDEALPQTVTTFSFPNENDENITFQLDITNSTIDGWGVGIVPGSDITIRDAPAVTVSAIIGLPWENQTVTLKDLARKNYVDSTWNIVDATLHFLNVTTYGWEIGAFANNNTVIIKNSDFTGPTLNSDHSTYIIENSTMDLVQGFEFVEMTITDSTIRGDVIAKENSKITLINTTVQGDGDMFGNIIATDNASVILVNSTYSGNLTQEDEGTIVIE